MTVWIGGGCMNQAGNPSGNPAATKQAAVQPDVQPPTGFTVDSIRTAFDEFINYHLWFDPSSVPGNSFVFEPYIGKRVDAEIRVYASHPDTPYIHTNVSDGLVVFQAKDGFVFGDGVATEGDPAWPSEESYTTAGEFALTVQPPRPPNYGASAAKNKMISAAERYIQAFSEDMMRSENANEWNHTKIYLVDFYEYESAAGVVFVREDDYAWLNSVFFTDNNGVYETQGAKGFGIENVFALDKHDPGRYLVDRLIGDAIREYVIQDGQLVKTGIEAN